MKPRICSLKSHKPGTVAQKSKVLGRLRETCLKKKKERDNSTNDQMEFGIFT